MSFFEANVCVYGEEGEKQTEPNRFCTLLYCCMFLSYFSFGKPLIRIKVCDLVLFTPALHAD